MVSVFSPVKEMEAEEYRRVTEVTYLGYVHGTLAALKRMLPRDRGMIVQVGSALAYRGIPLQSAYCAAKHAIQGFTESLRAELIHDGSHVQHRRWCSCPALNTPAVRLGRRAGCRASRSRCRRSTSPRSPRAASTGRRTTTGARSGSATPTFKAIVGNKIAPGFGDRYLANNGYESQQYDGPDDPDRPHNLWEPLPGDHGAHGDFDDRAIDHSVQVWATRHRKTIAVAGAGLAGLAAAAFAWRQGTS